MAALAAALAAIKKANRCTDSCTTLGRALVRTSKRIEALEHVIGRALEVLEDIEEARRLKEKRRRRYISALIISDSRLPVDPRVVQASIEEAIRELGGEILLADARPHLVYYDPVRGAIIVRTNHLALDAVIAALVTVRRIGGIRARIVPLRTAGTLSSARRALGILEKLPSRAG